jgi:hypothetical protein
MSEPRQGRHIQKMSLLTEREILFDWFLQICRADGAGNGAALLPTTASPVERSNATIKVTYVIFIVATRTGEEETGLFSAADSLLKPGH